LNTLESGAIFPLFVAFFRIFSASAKAKKCENWRGFFEPEPFGGLLHD